MNQMILVQGDELKEPELGQEEKNHVRNHEKKTCIRLQNFEIMSLMSMKLLQPQIPCSKSIPSQPKKESSELDVHINS